MDVLLLSFLELRDVPFRLHACSELCQTAIKGKYTDVQKELQRKMDAGYKDMVKNAHRLVKASAIDISPETINAPSSEVSPFAPMYTYRASHFNARRRRKQRCAIM